MKRAIVSLRATDTFVLVWVSCISRLDRNLIENLSRKFIANTVPEAKVEINFNNP